MGGWQHGCRQRTSPPQTKQRRRVVSQTVGGGGVMMLEHSSELLLSSQQACHTPSTVDCGTQSHVRFPHPLATMPTRREQLTALNAFVTLAASGGSRNRWITGDAFVVSQRGSTTAATGSATQASGGKQGKQQGKQQGKKQGKQQGKQQAKKGKQQGRETPEAKAARLAKKAALKAAKKAAAAAAAKDNAAAGAGGGEPAKPKAKPAKWEEPAETDAAFQKLSAFLTERGAAFTVSSHEAVRTSEEVGVRMRALGVDCSQ